MPRIDVIDDGAGLDAAGTDHAFDRFWRGANGKPGHDEGSGLGLAIVAAVAAAHGGTAYVDRSSERLRGAHFVVMLPIQPRV